MTRLYNSACSVGIVFIVFAMLCLVYKMGVESVMLDLVKR